MKCVRSRVQRVTVLLSLVSINPLSTLSPNVREGIWLRYYLHFKEQLTPPRPLSSDENKQLVSLMVSWLASMRRVAGISYLLQEPRQ